MATEIYSVFFSLLKEVVADKLSGTGFKLKKVLCDYEVGLHNAVKENFGSDIEISGCFFHFSQCLYWKVLSLGMKKEYSRIGSSVRKFSKMAMSLAHIPPSRLKEAYFVLKNFQFKEESEIEFQREMLVYLNMQWLNNPSQPVEKWNCYRRKQNLSNNCQENFNGRLKKKIKVHNPNPNLLLAALRKEMLIAKSELKDYEKGNDIKKLNKRQKRLEKQRKVLKERIKNEENYSLEKYMLAMGSLCMKSDLQQVKTPNIIENNRTYQSMCETPCLNVKNKTRRTSFLTLQSESESESNESAILPQPEKNRKETKSPKSNPSKSKCPKCKKRL